MPKFLIQGSYTAEGLHGLIKDGGSKRRAAIEQLAESLGGKLESFYFAFGESDVFVILEMPEKMAAAAALLNVSSTGAFQGKTTVLLTPEEIDEATKRSASYSPPGE